MENEMPARYEALRDKFDDDMPLSAAKTKAAKIFNATRKPGTPPVTGKHKPSKFSKLVTKLATKKGVYSSKGLKSFVSKNAKRKV